METSKKRNIIGSILCFLTCTVLGGIGVAAWMVREVWQSHRGGFPIEVDDIVRYATVGAVGYIFNLVLFGCLVWASM